MGMDSKPGGLYGLCSTLNLMNCDREGLWFHWGIWEGDIHSDVLWVIPVRYISLYSFFL